MFSASNGAIRASVTTRRPILSIRPKATFNSIVNRAEILSSVSAAVGDNTALIELVYNGTLTNASFGSAGASSVVEVDTAAAALANGIDYLRVYRGVRAGAGTRAGPIDARPAVAAPAHARHQRGEPDADQRRGDEPERDGADRGRAQLARDSLTPRRASSWARVAWQERCRIARPPASSHARAFFLKSSIRMSPGACMNSGLFAPPSTGSTVTAVERCSRTHSRFWRAISG